jgi:hypothetical protein
MILRPERDLTELLLDDAVVDRAIAEAQAEAVRRHALLGQPVVVRRQGRMVVEVPSLGSDVDPEGAP